MSQYLISRIEACAEITVRPWTEIEALYGESHLEGVRWSDRKTGVSETHAMHFKDIDGDGRPDLITGKRWWSHGRAEPGSDGPAAIYWFKNTKGADGIAQFTPMLIDDDSGIGTQFEVADINGDGLLDIISSNKKGVRVIVQVRE